MIHMLIGIQGSGKSTFAKGLSKQLNCEIISTDNYRKQGILETELWNLVYKNCAKALIENKEVIFDATNITPKVRKRFYDEVSKYNITPIIGAYYLDTDVNVCYERVKQRNKNKEELYLPEEVVLSYYNKIIPPTFDENFIFIKNIKDGKIIEVKYNEE